ncbi:MAG: iron-sulfur cluster scaffold-like protein [Thermodesulfobacteriota bacterium]|nr:MAG: iron-sulfur cluster scaffold-like protein [Thermodesulfobacteriota bacterium]
MQSESLDYILDHYKNPRNFGTIEDADFSYEEGIPSCGDVIRLDLKIRDNKLDDVKFSGTGCAISQASVSILTENVTGKEIGDVISLTDHDMLEALGGQVSPIRFKCALLGLTVLKKALAGIKSDS